MEHWNKMGYVIITKIIDEILSLTILSLISMAKLMTSFNILTDLLSDARLFLLTNKTTSSLAHFALLVWYGQLCNKFWLEAHSTHWKSFFLAISHLKIYPSVHLNTSKAQRHCNQKEKFIKSLFAFVILMF